VQYGEGLFIGYRYYDAKEMPVLFPFGYGLSYTTFAYSNAQVHTEQGRSVSAKTFRDVDGLIVTVDVTNTGHMAGKEIVQVYVHDHASGLVRPEKELKGFAKVTLQPGETKSVAIKLDFRAFAYYHPEYKQWITEDGDFDLLIGASSADIRCTQTVTLQSTLELPSLLDHESTLRDWLEDARGQHVFGPLFQQINAQMQAIFGGGESREGIGMEVSGFLMDMPLLQVLEFQRNTLPVAPEEMVAGLLAQVHGKGQ
jgi:beta-glucosidase